MPDHPLLEEFVDAYGDLDEDLADAYEEEKHSNEDSAVESLRDKLDSIFDDRLQDSEEE